MENPFTLKVGQVFTGFGIGCGAGIGVGRPLNLGAIPVLQQVMSATRGATDAFSGVGRHVNGSLRRFGVKSIEAGIGCGVGFGHGFGIGLAVKPGVVHQIQSRLGQAMAEMMKNLGMTPGLSGSQNILPRSLQNSMPMVNEISNKDLQTQMGSIMQLESKTTKSMSQGPSRDGTLHMESKFDSPVEQSLGSRSEKVVNSFLENPVLKDEGMEINELGERLRSENSVLQVLLKHQLVLEKLMEENGQLRQILVEDLKVSPSKLHASSERRGEYNTTCVDCFECRRRRRKSRQ